MFLTMEDETGIANLVVWPAGVRGSFAASLHERQHDRRCVRGRIQREGEVVHLVAHRLVDLSAELATVGSRDVAFPLSRGRGDQVTHAGGGPDPREHPPKGWRNVISMFRTCTSTSLKRRAETSTESKSTSGVGGRRKSTERRN